MSTVEIYSNLLRLFREIIRKARRGVSSRLFENAVWLFSDKVIRLGLNFLLTAYIARYLGVHLFGVWNYALSFVILFSFFSTLGIYNQLLRDLVLYPDRRNELLGSAFLIKLLGGFVTLGLAYTSIVVIKPEETVLHQMVGILAIGYIVQSFDVIDFFFQSQLKAKWITIARMMSFVVFGLVKVAFVQLEYPLLYFIVAHIGELVLSAIFLIIFFQKHFAPIFHWKVARQSALGMFKESMPIFFAEIAIIMYMRLDQIMIGELVGNETLGVFSAAVRLSELWYLIPGVICSTAFPAIINSYQNHIEYRIRLQKLYDLLIWLALSIALVVSFAAPFLVRLIYGEQFIEASQILIIHIWTSVFVFVGIASNQQLILENLSRISFYRTVVGVIVNVALNFVLIPRWGAKGAAFATLIAQAFSSVISSYAFPSSRCIFWMNVAALNPRRIYMQYLRMK